MKLMKNFALPTLLLVLVAIVPAKASDELGLCADEIVTYCSDVELGFGRLAACLYAHDTALSDACFDAVADEMEILDTVFEGLRYARQECGGDIAALCGDVPAGQGRLISCLAHNTADLSDSCAAIIGESPLSILSD